MKRNDPLSGVVEVRTRPVAVLVIVIVAPGTTAPCGSCTVPVISPVLDCANAALAARIRKSIETMNLRIMSGTSVGFELFDRRRIAPPPVRTVGCL